MSAGANIRESLTNANLATANIADDTEALKHNLLFRGFFKKRGYYNIANLSAEKYRKDRMFISPGNYRAWLVASDLFQKAANGAEELSPEGKSRLNAAVTQHADAFAASPFVIEGYGGGGGTLDQVSSSRNRAILVRDYLQRRFQLNSGSVGVVSLSNLPPPGLGHASWDGICIVIPRESL
jgi:phospholipid/cholesterol/gamma-HCH transport system substrate-binding protein